MSNGASRGPQAGGMVLALAVIAGAVIGRVYGEASLGFVIGVLTGIAAAVLIWLVDRRR
jgi:hypothetical protein